MGNSLRHSLGHMCGAETAKARPEDEGDQPVDVPKESKKKSKKHKKKLKVRNGKLFSIKEEHDEAPTELQPNGNSELPTGQGVSHNTFESQKHEDIPAVETLLEIADTPGDKAEKDELHIDDESGTIPVITISPSETLSNEGEEEVSSDINDSYVDNEENTVGGNNRVCDGDNVSLMSTAEEEPNIMVCAFNPVKTETIGIDEADDIFTRAFSSYELYIESGIKFKESILGFQQCVEPVKRSTDFLSLWHAFKARAEDSPTTESVLIFQFSNEINAMESAGLELIDVIDNVKPILDKCGVDADHIDAVKCAKDQIKDGDELMTTDNFSAPGKYRRNMSRLKKCAKHVAEIELETNEILRCLHVFNGEHSPQYIRTLDTEAYARESIIIPEERTNEHDLEDIFSNLSQESIPIAMSDCDDNSLCDENDDRPSTPLPTVELQVSPDQLSDDSRSDDNENEHFIDIRYVNDDVDEDSTQQVSKDISNSMELDFDIISDNVLSTDEKDADESVEEMHSPPQEVHSPPQDMHPPPQVHLEVSLEDQPFVVSAADGEVCEDVTVENIEIELECIPEVPECSESPVGPDLQETDQITDPDRPETALKKSDSSDSLSSKSINSLRVELDRFPDSEGSSIDAAAYQQSPPLSEDIISPISHLVITLPEKDEVEETDGPSEVQFEADVEVRSNSISSLDKDNDQTKFEEIAYASSDQNQTNFEEISYTITTTEETTAVEIQIVDDEEKPFEEVDVEVTCDTPPLEPELENIDDSDDSSIENIEPSDTDPSDVNNVSRDLSSSRVDSAIESDKQDSSADCVNVVECKASTPRSLTFPSAPYYLADTSESGVIMSDVESDRDTPAHLSDAEFNNFSDSCEEIVVDPNELGKGQDTTVISFNCQSASSPVALSEKIAIEEIHIDYSDSECHSDTTSIQEIQIISANNARNSTCKTNNTYVSEEPFLISDSSVSTKGIGNASTEEVDVALKVLKHAISHDDVQDEFVDLLCSSISRVLGDDDENPTVATNLKNIDTSHSSYDESSVHKSFQLSREVIDWVGTHFQSGDESDHYDDISEQADEEETEKHIIVPVDKGSVHSPHIISHTILKSEKHPLKTGDLVKTVNVSVEDITAEDTPYDNTPDDKQIQTFVIKSVPEKSESHDVLSPLGSPPLRALTPPCDLDMEPDHNTLDYGNYVFIDPSTGDIQVMRNRSRSLDSLVSMASSRSSISRFGSFEFVTDFEINIAEKNQEMMKTH